MPIFFSNFRQMWNISSIVCGTSDCSVDPMFTMVMQRCLLILVSQAKIERKKCTECVIIKGLNS